MSVSSDFWWCCAALIPRYMVFAQCYISNSFNHYLLYFYYPPVVLVPALGLDYRCRNGSDPPGGGWWFLWLRTYPQAFTILNTAYPSEWHNKWFWGCRREWLCDKQLFAWPPPLLYSSFPSLSPVLVRWIKRWSSLMTRAERDLYIGTCWWFHYRGCGPWARTSRPLVPYLLDLL